jgi:hypothetical protein
MPSLFDNERFNKANRSRMYDAEVEIDKLHNTLGDVNSGVVKEVGELKTLFLNVPLTQTTAGGFTGDYLRVKIGERYYKIQLLAD